MGLNSFKFVGLSCLLLNNLVTKAHKSSLIYIGVSDVSKSICNGFKLNVF